MGFIIYMNGVIMLGPMQMLMSGDITGFLLRILMLLPALVIAVSFHEAAHAWTANRMGDPTAKNLGRVTLDPTKHFTIWGIVMFLFVGFGWGKPVPTNPRNYYNYKKGNVLVALAGVTMNLIIAVLFMSIISVLTITDVFEFVLPNQILQDSSIANIIHTIMFYIAYLNLILFFFNLIPIPPLDGHHLVKGVIARRAPRFFMSYMRYGFMALLFLFFFVPDISYYLSELCLLIMRGVAFAFGAPFGI